MNESLVENISISLNEPKWLKEFRMDALQSFNTLPEEKSNLYTKHGLELINQLTVIESLKDNRVVPELLPLTEIAAGMETGHYYVSTQTETIASKNVRLLESDGVVFCDLHEALEKHSEILKMIFSKKAIAPSDDKYAALNSAFQPHRHIMGLNHET